MNPWQRYWILPVVALALIALAVWTTDPGVAAVFGGLAGGAAAIFLVLAFAGRVRFEGIVVPAPDADALVVLTRSFRAGRFGREEVLSRLDGFDLALGLPGRLASADQEAMLRAPESEFLDHVESRLQRLEALT